ncbi:beta-ketoacyl synthase N-terminal-like domain-containing protein, partial [Flavivirga jejuensis]
MKTNTNDIAVIGVSCRFPGAKDYKQYWDNLCSGISSIQEIPKKRWNWENYWGDPIKDTNKSNSKWGGFIKDIDSFDCGFFGLSGKEVEAMDPQQRIMLELSWSCFEDASIRPSDHSGDQIGVYLGVFNFDYKELQEKGGKTSIEAHHSTGTASAIIPNRISYFYNFNGPSVPVDTACSSSLHAIHLAIQSLQLGECNMALAGGISLILTPTRHISFSKTGMLSPTGSCKTFDTKADGYVRGEGAGVILLKPLSQALSDGDTVYGVIKGSAVNHGGKNYTLTYPNADAQAAVITSALKKAKVNPNTISYVEAHGTGTPKGDPIEFEGLIKAFGGSRKEPARNPHCGLGSVKANIGHLESAAGIAGFIKVLLALKHKQIPGQQNFHNLNTRIQLDKSPFYIVEKLQTWNQLRPDENKKAIPRRAGISSFGFGGTNAHIIIEEAPISKIDFNKNNPAYLIVFSAVTKESLNKKIKEFVHWMEHNMDQENIGDISANLLLGREHFEFRIAFVAKDKSEMLKLLKDIIQKKEVKIISKFINHFKSFSSSLFEHVGQNVLKELNLESNNGEESYLEKLDTLSQLYMMSLDLDWRSLFSGDSFRRISLPTYPFQQDRLWIPELSLKTSGVENNQQFLSKIHPFIHKNISDLTSQKYASSFDGEEPFLKDHVINDNKTFPAVAFLEMAIAAIKNAISSKSFNEGIVLRNLIWIRPILVDYTSVNVEIILNPKSSELIDFEIYTKSNDLEIQKITHCSGDAVLKNLTNLSPISSQEIKGQCAKHYYSSKRCYEILSNKGFSYGHSHKLLEEIWFGTNQALAKISSSSLTSLLTQYFLFPGISDACLQAAILLFAYEKDKFSDTENSFLPFSLKELKIFKRCENEMWAWVKRTSNIKNSNNFNKVDIILFNKHGAVCISMKDVSFKQATGISKSISTDKMLLTRNWSGSVGENPDPFPFDNHIVFFAGLQNNMDLGDIESRTLHSDADSMPDKFTDFAIDLFNQIQKLLKQKSNDKVLIQLVVPEDEPNSLFSALFGLLRTAQQENPRISCQSIALDKKSRASIHSL